MNKQICISLLSISCLAAGLTCRAEDAAIRKALTANYAAISTAFQKHDGKTIGSYLTPDFSAVNKKGQTTNRDQVLAGFEKQMSSIKNSLWVRTIETVTQAGNDAIVIVKGRLTGSLTDAEGAAHQMDFNAKAKDTWTKSGKAWKLKHTQILEAKMMLDGKERIAK